MKKEIIFGLGCFWWVQKYFDSIDWIIETEVWYAWGKQDHASYDNIGDHTEVVKINYDDEEITFTQLIQKFIEKKDPTFPNYKTQYDGLILYNTEDERDIAHELLYQVEQTSDREVTVRIEPKDKYFKAEEYHQNYLQKRENDGDI